MLENPQIQSIANSLALLAQAFAPKSPCYRYPLSHFADFDWASIGATVEKQNGIGAAYVRWNGYIWKRRVGTGKFGSAIWFSRSAGKSDDGSPDYHILVKFQDMGEIDEIPQDLAQKASARQRATQGKRP